MAKDSKSIKLPVVETFKETYSGWFATVQHWPRLLAAPVILMLLSQLVMPGHGSVHLAGMVVFGFAASILSFLANLVMIVNVLKFMLEKKMPDAPLWQLDLSKDVWRLLGWMIMFILIIVGIGAILSVCATILGLGSIATVGIAAVHPGALALFLVVSVFLVVLVVVRLGLLAPCVVMQRDVNPLKLSWRMTKRNVWRIIGAAILITLPVIVAMMLIGAILGVSMMGSMMVHPVGSAVVLNPLIGVIMAFVALLMQTINASALAIIFKKLK